MSFTVRSSAGPAMISSGSTRSRSSAMSSAVRALDAIRRAADLLQDFPFACRKVDDGNPFLRELVILVGKWGDVALFEIESEPATTGGRDELAGCICIIAVRPQREDDYH